jgi:hypothetical protein
MNHKPILAATVAIAAGSAFVACGRGNGTAGATTSAADTPSPAVAASAGGGATSASAKQYRAQVVAAATAWLKTLTAAQRKTASYSFGDTTDKEKWSNFPAFFKPRTGVAYKDMSATATTAGLALVKTVLSSQGYKQYGDIRKADDYLGATDSGGGPGGGAPPRRPPPRPRLRSPQVTATVSSGATTTSSPCSAPRRPRPRSWSPSTATT